MIAKILPLLVLMTLGPSVWANIPNFLDSLEKKDLDNLFKKNIIIKTIDVKDSPWPEVEIYGVINASPLEAFATYSDYEEQKNYVPEVIVSNPIKHISPTDTHVLYERNLPWPLSNVQYVTGNKMSKLDNGGYQLNWYQVKSSSSQDARGEVQFIPFNEGTLMKYRNFLKPNSFFAGLLRETMIIDIQTTITAIIKHIEQVKNNSEIIERSKNKIVKAFSQENQ